MVVVDVGVSARHLRAAAIAIAVALASPAAAQAAGWSPPETIADAVDTAFLHRPTVVAGPRGQLAAAWTQGDGIGFAFSPRGRPFGAPEVVPGSNRQYAPELGVDAAGNTTIAWAYPFDCTIPGDPQTDCQGIRAAARLASGRYTRTLTLTPRRYDTFGPSVSVAPDGRAAVMWGAFNGAGARVAARPGTFGRIELRNRDILTWTFHERARTAEVVLQRKRQLLAFDRGPGGKLRNRRVIASVRGSTSVFDTGTDRRGLYSAAWESVRRGTLGRDDVPSLLVALRRPSGVLGAPQTLARDRGQEYVYPADIATGATGMTVAAWGIRGSRPSVFNYDNAWEAEVHAAVSLPGARFGRSQRLEPRYPERPLHGLATAAGKRSALVAWRGTRANGSQGVWAAHAGARGRFGRPHLVSGDASTAMSDPAVAIDGQETAVVVWLEGLRVRVARLASAPR
jgi:hypothetical protein